MLAGHFSKPCQIDLIEIEEPVLAEDSLNEIIFQPELACLCGSDLPFFEHAPEVVEINIGQSLHEMIGTVLETSGSQFVPGDRVLAVPFEHHGLFERYVLTDERAILLDERVSDEEALMAQPLGTVIFALKKLPQVLDQDVVVVGQGPMGQLFNTALRNLGARKIIGIDLLESRLEFSENMGATHTICNATDDPVAAVQELTNGDGADVVVEVVGHRNQQLDLCMELCRYGGRVLYFGVPPEELNGVNWRTGFFKNLTLHLSVFPVFHRDFPLAMQWIGEGRINVKPLITHRFPLDQIQQAFELFHSRREPVQKVLIDFPSACKS